MSGMRKRRHDILSALSDLPVKVTLTETTRSNHMKVKLEHNGHEKSFFCAGSPSDHRFAKNFKSDVAQWIRQIDQGSKNEN